jgi:biotin operon repressor
MADNLLPPPEQLEEWAQRMPAVYAYLLLYLRAKAGQRDQEGLAISQASLAAAMDLTRDTVSRGIKRLSELGLVRLETDQHRTIIHVHKLAETSEPVKLPDNSAKETQQERTPGKPRFERPAPDRVTHYAESIGFRLDGQAFCDFYDSKGWIIGKSAMKDWKAAVRTWKKNAEPARLILPPAASARPSKRPEPPPEEIVEPKDIHDLVVKLAGGAKRRMP